VLEQDGSVSVADLRTRFGISPMTARRDLAVLEEAGLVRRSYGGAVLEPAASSEASFRHRVATEVEAKQRLAIAAANLVAEGDRVLLDSSSTAYFLARRIVAERIPATLITNSLPVMSLVAEDDGGRAALYGLCGEYRTLARSFVGPRTTGAIGRQHADTVFLSTQGVAEDGYLTEPHWLEADVKRTMMRSAGQVVLLVDASKLGPRGLNVIARLSAVTRALVADAGERVRVLARAGVEVQVV